MLPQHWSNQDYCFLVSVMRVKPRQLHQMADSTNPSLGGHVIQWCYLWVIPKITGGFRVIAPFTCLFSGLLVKGAEAGSQCNRPNYTPCQVYFGMVIWLAKVYLGILWLVILPTKCTQLTISKTIANQNSNYLSIFYFYKPKKKKNPEPPVIFHITQVWC